MPELKRCPFCGDIVGYFGYDCETGICLVSCNGCSAKIEVEAGDSVTARNAATESWNRRTPEYRTQPSPPGSFRKAIGILQFPPGETPEGMVRESRGG